MKKIITGIMALGLALLSVVGLNGVNTKNASADKLTDFYDDFESYEVDGKFLEDKADVKAVWDNNVFKGGEALGMDSHIREVGKIEYENGVSGNKVLHLNNTTGQNTFFYMGPKGDFRAKNFTAEFKLKLKVEEVVQHCWVGVSFRKKAETFYTGTNNLLFNVVRDLDSAAVYGQGYAVFDGGSAIILSDEVKDYGERINYVPSSTTVSGATTDGDTPWMNYKLEVSEDSYVLTIDGVKIIDCKFSVPNFDYFGYLSLNCCCANALIDDFKITVNDETLPPVIAPLGTPEITLDKESGKLSWTEVENADSYRINCGDREKIVAGYVKEYDLNKLRLPDGEYKITVTAVTPDAFLYLDGLPSAELIYTVGTPKKDEKKSGCGSSVGFAILPVLALCGVVLGKKKEM